MNQILIDLISFIIPKLSGKQVMVRSQSPATIGCIGEIHCSPAGQLVIDISPDIKDDEKLLHVVLHEIAHAKHHNFVRSNEIDQKPQTIVNKSLNRGDELREDTADKQADEWEQWGRLHANKRLLEIAPFEAVMIALLDYPGGKE